MTLDHTYGCTHLRFRRTALDGGGMIDTCADCGKDLTPPPPTDEETCAALREPQVYHYSDHGKPYTARHTNPLMLLAADRIEALNKEIYYLKHGDPYGPDIT